MTKKRKQEQEVIDKAAQGPLVKDARMQRVLAFGVTNFRRLIKRNKFAGKGEGARVLAKRRANIAAGKVQVSK